MSKNNYKIYRGENIVYNNETIKTKEIVESSIVLAEIAKYIKKYRMENNLTQKELADILEVNQVMISKLERGDYNPTLKQLIKISYKLTNSNKIFMQIMKDILKSIKEDYSYDMKDVYPDKEIDFFKNNEKNSKSKCSKKTNKKKICA